MACHHRANLPLGLSLGFAASLVGLELHDPELVISPSIHVGDGSTDAKFFGNSWKK